MLRTVNAQPTLWEALLPEMCLGLPAELEAVDRLLDDPAFFAPYRRHFHPIFGRPSVPIETYLRLMFLKFRYKLGFEPLCREVADSISWQRFCRIPLGVAVPHPTTLMKITTRCGTQAIEELNDALLAKALEAKVLKTNKVRADTTVVEANVAYPSDSSLLAKGVAKMAKTAKKLQAMGFATRTKMADRTRSVLSRARSINANLQPSHQTIGSPRCTASTPSSSRSHGGSHARPTPWSETHGERSPSTSSGRARLLVDELATTAELTRKIADADRRADGRRHAGRFEPHRLAARSRRPGDQKGPSRQAGRVRLQGPARRQRGRGDPRPQRRDRQSGRRLDARTGRAAHQGPHRTGTSRRRPPIVAMARPASSNRCAKPGSATSCCRRRANRTPPAGPSRSDEPSRRWSAGEPDAKDGSAARNATSASPGPASMGSREREPGAGTASSPTTW